MKHLRLLAALTSFSLLALTACKKDKTTTLGAATYTVTYKITGAASQITTVKYADANGDTVTIGNPGDSWAKTFTESKKSYFAFLAVTAASNTSNTLIIPMVEIYINGVQDLEDNQYVYAGSNINMSISDQVQ